MGNDRKYYWLKLNEAFFEDDTIEWIEEQENGEKYVLFYLKLCLKSLKDEGYLIRYVGEKLIPYDIKALAKLTNTEKDTVTVALRVFEEIGLIERNETGDIYMKQIEEMIGSETESAKRVRKHRARQKALHCNTDVIKSNTEIEKETEIDIRDRDKREETESRGSGPETNKNLSLIAKEYEHCGFGTLDMKTKDLLEALLEEYSVEWILKAFEIAVESNKRTLKYARGILTNWRREGGMKDGRDRTSDRKPKEEVECEGDRIFEQYEGRVNYEDIGDIDF